VIRAWEHSLKSRTDLQRILRRIQVILSEDLN
jgi:hypothetical protein